MHLIFFTLFMLVTASSSAQGPPVFIESFYTALVVDDDDDDTMQGLEACGARFRAALTGTGVFQERTSREVEEVVSSCNNENASPDWVEQCLLESTQTEVDLVLVLSVQTIRRRGFIFEARAVRPMGNATVWGDDIHIEGEEIIVLAAREACGELAVRLVNTLGAANRDNSNNPTENNIVITPTSWSVIELVDVSPRSTTVDIDGVEVGVTPGQFGTSPGMHTLTLSAPGYASIEREVRAPENSILTLNDLALEPADAIVTITSNVAGASIIIDGRQMSTTVPGMPIQVEISPDSRRLEVQREGYITWSQALNLSPAQNATFSVDLVLIPETAPTTNPVTTNSGTSTDQTSMPLQVGDFIQGELIATDRQLQSGEFADYFSLTIANTQTVRITMTSNDLNAYLLLRSDTGTQDQDNDDVNGTNSSILGTLPPGTYTVAATTSSPREQGDYTLSVTAEGGSNAGPTVQNTGGETFTGRLEPGDSTLNSGEYTDSYPLNGVVGETVILELTSTEFDPYLMVRSPWLQLDNDDMEPGNFNSRLEMTIPVTGEYDVTITSYSAGESGAYTLRIIR